MTWLREVWRHAFAELAAVLSATGATVSVGQCQRDLERVQRDLYHALDAQARAVSQAGIAAAHDELGYAPNPNTRRGPSWMQRDADNVVPIRKVE